MIEQPTLELNAFNVSWLTIYLTFAGLLVIHLKAHRASGLKRVPGYVLISKSINLFRANWLSAIGLMAGFAVFDIANQWILHLLDQQFPPPETPDYPTRSVAFYRGGEVAGFIVSSTIAFFWIRGLAHGDMRSTKPSGTLPFLIVFFFVFYFSLTVFELAVWVIPSLVYTLVTGRGFAMGIGDDIGLIAAVAIGGVLLALLAGRYAHLSVALPAVLHRPLEALPGIVNSARVLAIPLAILLLALWSLVHAWDGLFAYVEMLVVFNGYGSLTGGGGFAGNGQGIDIPVTLAGQIPRALVRAFLFLAALTVIRSAYEIAVPRGAAFDTGLTKTPPG